MIKIIRSVEEWQKYRASINDRVMDVGFVPTMGNLHEGHLSLLARSAKANDLTVISIFVNPTQFNNPEDLQKYPRTLEQDIQLAAQAGADVVFAPAIGDMYPLEYRYQVKEVKLSRVMEGVHRPGHFDGMLTIVLKLLNLVRPKNAYFGEKDYQQYQLITDMVAALFLPMNVIPCPTIRDQQGLALSSRNGRLSADGIEKARRFASVLGDTQMCAQEQREALLKEGFEVDYIEDHYGRRYGAVFVEEVRLIDNVPLVCEEV